MNNSIYALVPQERMESVLKTLHQFTELSIKLIDADGELMLSFGTAKNYCAILEKRIFKNNECFQLLKKAGERAQAIGEAYIFSCHANLNHIAFPLISQGELLGSIIVGPFLMDKPDSTLVSDVAENYQLPTSVSLELYDELETFQIIEPAKVNHLKDLIDHLLSPLLPGERAVMLQLREKMTQQAKINETIKMYKNQSNPDTLQFFRHKERQLIAEVQIGDVKQAKGVLNDLIGYVLFTEGRNLEAVRLRAIELTTLLSRIAMDGGAKADMIYNLNSKFLTLMAKEQDLDDLCFLLQDVVESFVSTMFYERDKGNLYIRQGLRYISDNYTQRITLEQVANHVHLSPCYFSSMFTEVVGVSFREYLCRLRVEESKRLLLSPQDYSMTDIAISMGFPDQSYYCKVFKRIVGLTPGKYRAVGR